MPLNLTDFLQAPMVRGTNEGLGDMFSGGVNAYQQAQKHQQLMKERQQLMQEQAMKNALLGEFGRQKELAHLRESSAISHGHEISNLFAPKEKEAGLSKLEQEILNQKLRNLWLPREKAADLRESRARATGQEWRNQYYPLEAEQGLKKGETEIERNKLLNQFLPQEKNAELRKLWADIIARETSNQYISREKEAEIENALLEGNRRKIENKFIKPKREQELEQGAQALERGSIENKWLPKEKKQAYERNKAALESEGLKNYHDKIYSGKERELGIRSKKAEADRAEFKNEMDKKYEARQRESDINLKDATKDYYKRHLEVPQSELGKLQKDYENVVAKKGVDSPEAQAMWSAIGAKGKAQPKIPAQTLGKAFNGQIADRMRVELAKDITPPYIGTGSNKELYRDWQRYKNTGNEKEKMALAFKLAKSLTAEKLAQELSNLQLISQGITPTNYAKRGQLKVIRQGWPESLEWFENNMPKEIHELADQMHFRELQKLSKVRNDAVNDLMNGKDIGDFNAFGEEMIPGISQ